MPTYTYKCLNGHVFETQQSIKDDPLTECKAYHMLPACNYDKDGNMMIHHRPSMQCKAPVERLINFEGGIVFKGNGWTPKNS